MARKTFKKKAEKSVLYLTERDQVSESDELVDLSGHHHGSRLKNAREIPIEKIKPDPDQPRKEFNQQLLEELAASIKEHGVKQPISVEYIESDDYFKINVGERRYRACLLIGLTHMPCIVEKIDPKKRLAVQLMENIQREDLSPIEKARGLIEYKMSLGQDAVWKDVEKVIGISKRRRAQLIELLNLPEEIQAKIVVATKKSIANIFTEKHARSLLMLKEEEDKMNKLFMEIINSDQVISGNDAIKMAKQMMNSTKLRLHSMTIKYIDKTDLIAKLKVKLKELQKQQG